MNHELKQRVLLALSICTIITVNIAGAKTTTVLGTTFSVGLIIFPIIAIIQDTITEVLGVKTSKQFLYIGLCCSFFVSAFLYFAIQLPPSSRYLDQSESYNTVFGQSIRVMIASLVAFGISDLADIFVFQKIKKLTNGKYLILRTNLSTTISVILDTFLFMFLAFLYTSPKYTPEFVLQLTIPYLVIKLVWFNLSSPIVIPVVRWFQKNN